MTKKRKRKPKEPTYKVQTLVRANEFSAYSDILLALFDSQDFITKSTAQKALKEHLEREV